MVTCWCGVKNAHFHDPRKGWTDGSCAGTGSLNCYCGGDFCACHNHGEIECPGCEDCKDLDNDDYDDDAPARKPGGEDDAR